MIRVARFAVRKAPPPKNTTGLSRRSSLASANNYRVASVAFFSSSPSIIPERNIWDTIYSGSKGLWSLVMSEESRQKFMDIVQGSVINADVLKQARFGNMLTMALFHDLQDPLFQKYSFDASEFLTGVKPALTNFHETLGQLQNEFPTVASSKEERTKRLTDLMHQLITSSMPRNSSSNVSSGTEIKNYSWTEHPLAEKLQDPDSTLGKLSKMVVPSLLDTLFLNSEVGAMVANYKVGSTGVSSVALLSARAMVMHDEGQKHDDGNAKASTSTVEKFDEKTGYVVGDNDDKKSDLAKMDSSAVESEEGRGKGSEEQVKAENQTGSSPEGQGESLASTESDRSEEMDDADTTPVAAQIQVLYEMNQTIEIKQEIMDDMEGQEDKPLPTRVDVKVLVGTFEGWLNGGPDGALRWRITHLRPPTVEFPGM